MKFMIVGFHGSGKHEIIDTLKKEGLKIGKLFTNIENNLYSNTYDVYDDNIIREIFENNAYYFFKEVDNDMIECYEGMNFYEYDGCDAFALSPDQFVSIPAKNLKDEICIILLDNNQSNRKARHINENRKYNFYEREKVESTNTVSYINGIYSIPKAKIIYFNNEEPQRVAAIVKILHEHPEYIDYISKKFN